MRCFSSDVALTGDFFRFAANPKAMECDPRSEIRQIGLIMNGTADAPLVLHAAFMASTIV
jgi:hypothetical protein